MLTNRIAGVGVAAVMLLLPVGPAGAADPTLTDIATCNEQAAAATSGSALPRRDRPGPPEASAPIVEGEHDLPPRGGEKSDPTGSIVTDSPDPLVKGMDAQKAGDPAYRTAYRACMQKRGSR
jgi:hypothetical protein